MWILIRVSATAFLDLALGRRAPQDLPASHALLVPVYVAYVGAGFLLSLVGAEPGPALRATLVDAALLPLFTVAVLWLRSVPARWLQTLTALAGMGMLFTLAALPPYLLMALAPDTPFAALASLVVLLLFGWNVIALGHILRHALSLAYPAGVLVAVAYVAINMAVIRLLVPEVAA